MKRTVSLLAATTEMVYALDRGDWLIGRSHECDYPPQVEALPVVTRANIVTGTSRQIHDDLRQRQKNGLSLYDVDEALLRELRPELILTQDQCEVCAITPDDVARAARDITGGETEIVSIKPMTLEDVWVEFLRVAEALQAKERAELLLQEWRERLRPIPETGKTMVLLEWLEPLMGCGYWTPDLVAAAGCREPLGRPGNHAPWLELSQLESAQPDIVVLAPCGMNLDQVVEEARRLELLKRWNCLKAVRQGRLYAVDGNAYFSRSGPRLVDSADILREIVAGEAESGRGWTNLLQFTEREGPKSTKRRTSPDEKRLSP